MPPCFMGLHIFDNLLLFFITPLSQHRHNTIIHSRLKTMKQKHHPRKKLTEVPKQNTDVHDYGNSGQINRSEELK